MIGDRRFDIEGAQAHRLTGIGVAYGYALPGELEEAGADFVVQDVAELQKAAAGKRIRQTQKESLIFQALFFVLKLNLF